MNDMYEDIAMNDLAKYKREELYINYDKLRDRYFELAQKLVDSRRDFYTASLIAVLAVGALIIVLIIK